MLLIAYDLFNSNLPTNQIEVVAGPLNLIYLIIAKSINVLHLKVYSLFFQQDLEVPHPYLLSWLHPKASANR